jgi:hypothetical protein
MGIEDGMVLPSYAVVDPRTVMVKSIHALVTEVAVSRPWAPYNLTKRAQRTRVAFVKKVLEIGSFALFQVSWV